MTEQKTYGCHNRPPFAPFYYATGGRQPIPHVMTRDCQYRKTDLGKADPKCEGCKHREQKTT
jgi:hypothetical protein